MTTNSFLQAAEYVGNQLCRDAIWKSTRCNWLGMGFDKTYFDNVYEAPAYVACDPSIYEGTSGIALFLSQLYTCSSESVYKKTAMGAINQALSQAQELENRFGFFSGLVGIGYATALLGITFNDKELISEGLRLIANSKQNIESHHGLDVIEGNAGAISAIISLYRVIRKEFLLDMAISLGDQLINTAVKDEIGWSWNTLSDNKGITKGHNLTGFAHGVSGIACSLLELYHETGNEKYLAAAEHGFRYERYWFSSLQQNWPDFREFGLSEGTSEDFNYLWQWCHGAPGIGLSRLRAYQILGKDVYRQEAQIAIQSTKRWLDASNSIERWNYSLCHGLAGNAELFIYASSILKSPTLKHLADFIGIGGIERFIKMDLPWPCGVSEGESPSLMVGLAGIGHFYLRLYDPLKVKSLVLIT